MIQSLKHFGQVGTRRSWLLLITLCFVILFLYTAWTKWADYAAFQDEISHSLWKKWIPVRIAWVVPFAESILAALLLISRSRLLGLLGTLSFMAIASAYLIATLNSQAEIPCACGGVIDQLPKREHLVLNISLTVLAAVGIFLNKLKPVASPSMLRTNERLPYTRESGKSGSI